MKKYIVILAIGFLACLAGDTYARGGYGYRGGFRGGYRSECGYRGGYYRSGYCAAPYVAYCGPRIWVPGFWGWDSWHRWVWFPGYYR